MYIILYYNVIVDSLGCTCKVVQRAVVNHEIKKKIWDRISQYLPHHTIHFPVATSFMSAGALERTHGLAYLATAAMVRGKGHAIWRAKAPTDSAVVGTSGVLCCMMWLFF